VAEFPALPLWTDAYLGDTTHLTTIEHGAYLLLLMTAWRAPGTRLPDDDRLLARYARLTGGQWARIKPVISDFFAVENGWWLQSRLTDEALAVRRFRERQAEKGIASALKRKGRHSTPVDPGSEPVDDRLQPDGNLPTPTPIPRDKSLGGDAKRGRRLPSDFVVPDEWRQWAIDDQGMSRADADRQTALFVDHWAPKAGKDGTKTDWFGTWRNWCRRAPQFERVGGQASKGREYMGI
jgi:uncharacterized protein YdaU (DUF1376 family)